MKTQKKSMKPAIAFVIGVLVTIAVIFTVMNWDTIMNKVKGIEEEKIVYVDTKFEKVDRLYGIYSWDEVYDEETEVTDPHTKYVATFEVDGVTYVAGFNYANDFKVSFFGFGDEFKSYNPEWCRVA